MKHNVGSYDAAVRYVAGWLIMLGGVHFGSWWGWLGVLPLVTAGFAYCPLYRLFRWDTTASDRRIAP